MLQYCNDIQQGILAAYSVVSNCSVGTVSAGSVVVPTTVAFSGANSDAATKAQGLFASDLKSGSASQVFGSDFGTVTVAASSVTTGNTANPSKLHNYEKAVCCHNNILLVCQI